MENITEQIKKALGRYAPISYKTALALSAHTKIKSFSEGDLIERENKKVYSEYVLLEGILRSFIIDNNGNDITINFFRDSDAVTPILMRSLNDIAFYNLEVLSKSATVLEFNSEAMFEHMDGFDDLQQFGFRVMMTVAMQGAEREVVLLKSSGKEKLEWFRERFPNLENEIPHYHISSFLGMTPTSLSRLRSEKK